MYRDMATALDEHDRAVGAILIGEALVDDCDHAVSRIQLERESEAIHRWRAVAKVQDTYPEIWRHLDRARRVLASRGGNTLAYDELRPHVPRAATDLEAESVDAKALGEAKRAIAELKLAVPGADWKAIAARTDGLVRVPLLGRRRRQRLAISGVLVTFLFAIITWGIAIIPERKPDRAKALRHELVAIQQQRKIRIEFLSAELGDRCLPIVAHELVRLLVLDGRGGEATGFASEYTSRCGSDATIEHWAHAPRPGH